MFYHMTPAKYLATADSRFPTYVYREIRTQIHIPARFIFSQRSSRVVRPALTFTVYAYTSTRLGRLTFRQHVRFLLFMLRGLSLISSADLFRQVPDAIYARLVDTPVELVNPVADLLFCVAHGERWPSLTFRLLYTLLPQRLAKFIISRVALKTVLYL